MADKQSAPVAPSHVLLAADSSSHARLGNTVVTATDLSDLIRRLKSNPDVLGIARYGTRAPDDMTPGGDFDLFVILRERPADVESVHFHCGGIPVDMNVRTLADLRADAPLTEIDIAIATSELLYDPTGDVAALSTAVAERWQAATPRLTEHEINWSRFCQRHALDKVRHRLDSEPLLADLLLSTNVYWLLQTYFRVRSVPYPGEKPALAHIQDAEPAMCTLMSSTNCWRSE
ncbi:MAG: hypothetical protein ABGY41_07860 [Candidatus Poribacteria bacterium]